MRYLILNADDFGLCPAANEAVERLFAADALSSATLMVPAPCASDGIERAKRNKKMRIGLHITTTCEYDALSFGAVDKTCQSLMQADGSFYQTARENLAHATKEDMLREIDAQYRWMVDRDVPPEHVDSHMATVYGLHGFSCMDAVLSLCSQHNLHFRFPKMPETFSPDVPASLRTVARETAKKAASLGVGLPDGLFTYDFDVKPQDSYEAFRGRYMEMVQRCPEGISELFMHPCIETEQLKQINAQWKKRVWEFQVLLDPVFRECISRENITLTAYGDAPFVFAHNDSDGEPRFE